MSIVRNLILKMNIYDQMIKNGIFSHFILWKKAAFIFQGITALFNCYLACYFFASALYGDHRCKICPYSEKRSKDNPETGTYTVHIRWEDYLHFFQ